MQRGFFSEQKQDQSCYLYIFFKTDAIAPQLESLRNEIQKLNPFHRIMKPADDSFCIKGEIPSSESKKAIEIVQKYLNSEKPLTAKIRNLKQDYNNICLTLEPSLELFKMNDELFAGLHNRNPFASLRKQAVIFSPVLLIGHSSQDMWEFNLQGIKNELQGKEVVIDHANTVYYDPSVQRQVLDECSSKQSSVIFVV